MLRRLVTLGLPLWLVACGAGAPGAPPQTPADAAARPTGSADAPAAKKKASGLGELPAGVAAPDSACTAYTGASAVPCSSGDFTERLAAALSVDGVERDGRLRCLEADETAPAGLIRALRAELAPRGCADVVVGEDASVAGASRDIADTLVALGVGARLYRSVREAPLPHAPFDKPTFLKHFKEVLSPWIAAQAHAVDVLSRVGPRLNGYAKGIVALEAGLADMRFVSVARSIALPDEMKNDPEIKETYLVALELALEPRTARGRDAALVGLGELSRQGVTNDARVRDARQLLSELYAGRRLDALDKLMLPSWPAPKLLASPDAKATPRADVVVAARAPAFYSVKLSGAASVDDPELLEARLQQGVPPAVWMGSPPANLKPATVKLWRRGLFQLGQTYFWAEPFGRIAALPASDQDPEAALLAALAQVLAKGPRNAAAMMLGPPTLPPELRDTSTLDALTKLKGPTAGLAEFDAAYVRGLAPPQNDPAFWKEQAKRFSSAQKKLEDKARKGTAGELAKAALDTEKELTKQAAASAPATKATAKAKP